MKYNTKKEALAAVKKNGLNLEFVTKELKDFEVCFAALHNNEDSLKFVPMQILKDNFSDINDSLNLCNEDSGYMIEEKNCGEDIFKLYEFTNNDNESLFVFWEENLGIQFFDNEDKAYEAFNYSNDFAIETEEDIHLEEYFNHLDTNYNNSIISLFFNNDSFYIGTIEPNYRYEASGLNSCFELDFSEDNNEFVLGELTRCDNVVNNAHTNYSDFYINEERVIDRFTKEFSFKLTDKEWLKEQIIEIIDNQKMSDINDYLPNEFEVDQDIINAQEKNEQ